MKESTNKLRKKSVGADASVRPCFKGIQKENKGITLIALIITIVVMLILVGVTVSFTIGENGILSSTKEAKFKTEVSQLIEEYYINLEVAKMDKNFKVEDLYANKELGNLKEWIPTIQEKYEEKLYIEQGILYGNDNLSEQEKEWLQEMGIECNVATVISNTDLWELSTTNNKNDTIEKYKGTLSNGDSIDIPKIIVDKTTGETYRIKRINDCFDKKTTGYILLSNITIPDSITIAELAFSANGDSIYTENMIIGDNVVFESVNIVSNENNLSTLKVGNNVNLENLGLASITLMGSSTSNKRMELTIGDNCSNFEEFYSFKVINIGNNATISKDIGFISEQINIGTGLTISSAPGKSYYSRILLYTSNRKKS